MTTGAGTDGNTAASPRLDLLAYFPDDDDAEFRATVDRIRAELATRPPFLLVTFEAFVHQVATRPKRFFELHGAQGLQPRERRQLEPRLWARRRAYILVVGALLIWTDLCSLRCGKLVAGDRVFGLGQEWLQKVTGLNLVRIRRAIADLVAAEYLGWKQPIARYVKAGAPGGVGHAAWNAIYRFEVRFFERLHLDRKLAKQRRRAAERRANRVRIYGASLQRSRDMHRRALRSLRSRSVDLLGQPTQGEPFRPRPRPRPKP